MTIDDAASTLNITEGSLKDLLRDGELPGKKKRGRWVSCDGLAVRARKRRLDAAMAEQPQRRKAKRKARR